MEIGAVNEEGYIIMSPLELEKNQINYEKALKRNKNNKKYKTNKDEVIIKYEDIDGKTSCWFINPITKMRYKQNGKTHQDLMRRKLVDPEGNIIDQDKINEEIKSKKFNKRNFK